MRHFEIDTSPLEPPFEKIPNTSLNGEFVSDVPPAGMQLGLNLCGVSSWQQGYMFANLMYHASRPERVVGTDEYTHYQGLIKTPSLTDKFRFVLADSRKYLSNNTGIYTVLNPSRQKIAMGGWGAPQDASFTTAAEFTFEIKSTDTVLLALWVQGSLQSPAGNVEIIFPGHLDSWRSGNVWHEQFLKFYESLNIPVVRTMDWNNASNNIEQDWHDRVLPGFPTLNRHFGGQLVPYEFMCDLAKRIKAEFWVCIPYRATEDYMHKFGELFAKQYPIKKKLWLEYANEIWNSGVPWGGGTNWITSLHHTRYLARVDAATGVLTVPEHNLTTGERIQSYESPIDRQKNIRTPWQLTQGVGTYANVLSSQTFELYYDSELTQKVNMPLGKIDLLYHRAIEPGFVTNQNLHYGHKLLQMWDAIETRISPKRLKRIVGSWAFNDSYTGQRMSVPGMTDRADMVSIAPYFDGTWWGVRVAATDGKLVPAVWSVDSAMVTISVYEKTAVATSPDTADILAGKGALSKQVMDYRAGVSNFVVGDNQYQPAVAIEGLVNDQEYDVYFTFLEGAVQRVLKVSISPTSQGSNGFAQSTYAEQALMQTLSVNNNTNGHDKHLARVVAAGGDPLKIPVVAYEGGPHYHQRSPAEVASWVEGYLESPEHAGVTKRYLHRLASKGMTTFCYFSDTGAGRFKMSSGYWDTIDERYKIFDQLKGFVPKLPAVNLPNRLILPIEEEGTLPLFVAEYPDLPGTVYSVIGGDNTGNFAFDGNKLMLVNLNGMSWAKPRGRKLTIYSDDGYLTATGKLQVAFGKAWYEADSIFAWSPKGTVDTVAMYPEIGNTIPLTAGTGAVSDGELWKFNEDACYHNPKGMESGIALNKSMLFASVVDLDGWRGYYKFLNKISNGNFMALYFGDHPRLNMYSYIGSAGPDLPTSPKMLPVGKHVHWVFYDNVSKTWYSGIDQTTEATVVSDRNTHSLGSHVYIGGHDWNMMRSKAKHGCMQVLNREGMTLVEAKRIIGKMATHHGI